jgi:hypothetical protein
MRKAVRSAWLLGVGVAAAVAGCASTPSSQSIAIARFASASGATYAFSDLSGSFGQKPAPSTVFTDSADGAVGSADPTLDSEGNAFVDITAHVGDYLVAVQEFSAKTPDPAAAKALLLQQVEALKSAS